MAPKHTKHIACFGLMTGVPREPICPRWHGREIRVTDKPFLSDAWGSLSPLDFSFFLVAGPQMLRRCYSQCMSKGPLQRVWDKAWLGVQKPSDTPLSQMESTQMGRGSLHFTVPGQRVPGRHPRVPGGAGYHIAEPAARIATLVGPDTHSFIPCFSVQRPHPTMLRDPTSRYPEPYVARRLRSGSAAD